MSVTYSYPRIVYFIYETRKVENFFRRWIKKVIEESLIFFSIIASKNIYIIIGKLSQEVTIRNIDINCVYIYIYIYGESINRQGDVIRGETLERFGRPADRLLNY